MVVGYQESEGLTTNQKLIAGVISGMTTRFISQPLDIIKVRTQLQSRSAGKRRTWLSLSLHMLKEEGFLAFWHGHCLGQMHSIVSVSAQFHVYELTTRFVEKHYTDPQYRQFFLFLCGIFAGCVSAALVSPLEVIRVRQMLVKAQYGGVWQGAVTVYRHGGLPAFYEGLTASLAQMGPQVGITFSVFRLSHPYILQYVVSKKGDDDGEIDQNQLTSKEILITTTIAGSLAGFVSKTLTYPFDLAKRRLQIADGLPGLFRGWAVTIYKAQWNSVIAFTTYEMMCHAMRESNLQP